MRNRKKGLSQIDFVISIGIFIVIFAFVMQYILSYYANIGSLSQTLTRSNDAQSLLSIANFEYVPEDWPENSKEMSSILLMHLNNGTGESDTLFRDFSGRDNNGTCSGNSCPAFNESGIFGNAYTFDGINDYIEIPESTSIKSPSTTNKLTISAWVNVKTYSECSGNCSIVTKSGDYGIQINKTGHIIFSAGSGPWAGGQSISKGVWQHVAVVYDESNIIFYLNGESTSSSYSDVMSGNNNHLFIGSQGGTEFYFNGTIDELSIYNRTLSSQDIMNQYNYGMRIRRIGLNTKAYRFLIIVNNTKSYYYDNSDSVNLVNELVSFNYTKLGFDGADYKSTVIYDESNNTVPYQINNSMITFKTDITANQIKWFTVYFDDDSHFRDMSSAISGNNYINETILNIEKINAIQYKKYMNINGSNYTSVKNNSATKSDFRIRIYDTDTSSYVFTYGDTPPRSGDIISQQTNIIYQNRTAGIRKGKLIVQSW